MVYRGEKLILFQQSIKESLNTYSFSSTIQAQDTRLNKMHRSHALTGETRAGPRGAAVQEFRSIRDAKAPQDYTVHVWLKSAQALKLNSTEIFIRNNKCYHLNFKCPLRSSLLQKIYELKLPKLGKCFVYFFFRKLTLALASRNEAVRYLFLCGNVMKIKLVYPYSIKYMLSKHLKNIIISS